MPTLLHEQAGVNILCIYRFGSHRMGLESPHYALPKLVWLGARSAQLQRADAGAFQVRAGMAAAQRPRATATIDRACIPLVALAGADES
jgi:hypothetical protein